MKNQFDSNPRCPPFLLYVRCKFGVTFVRRRFRDGLIAGQSVHAELMTKCYMEVPVEP